MGSRAGLDDMGQQQIPCLLEIKPRMFKRQVRTSVNILT
jgi:hypothetical protein